MNRKRIKSIVIFSLISIFILTGSKSVSAESNQIEENNFSTAKMIELTNKEREKAGVDRLSANQALNTAARLKAEDMMAKDYFAHVTPDDKKPWDFVDRASYSYVVIGENLAMNFIAADDAHSALMASPLHRKNILNPRFGEIGLAVINGEMFGKNTKVLVQLFGSRTIAAAFVAEIASPSLPAETPPAVELEAEPLPIPLASDDSIESNETELIQKEKTEVKADSIPEEKIQTLEPEKEIPLPEQIKNTSEKKIQTSEMGKTENIPEENKLRMMFELYEKLAKFLQKYYSLLVVYKEI